MKREIGVSGFELCTGSGFGLGLQEFKIEKLGSTLPVMSCSIMHGWMDGCVYEYVTYMINGWMDGLINDVLVVDV